jgi:hypothetical protein
MEQAPRRHIPTLPTRIVAHRQKRASETLDLDWAPLSSYFAHISGVISRQLSAERGQPEIAATGTPAS